MEKILRNSVAVLAFISFMFISAQASASVASTASFYVDWSGADYGNGAVANGLLTVNLYPGSKFSNSVDGAWLFPNEDVVDFTVTVSGAVSGNGTYELLDFDFIMFSTKTNNEWPLDLTRELLGQATTGGEWGSDTSSEGLTGEFNLFATEGSGAPTSYGAAFLMSTNEGLGDVMQLVSFRPVPIPSALWLFATALLGLVRMGYKRID